MRLGRGSFRLAHNVYCEWCGMLISQEVKDRANNPVKFCSKAHRPDGRTGCAMMAKQYRFYWRRQRPMNRAVRVARAFFERNNA